MLLLFASWFSCGTVLSRTIVHQFLLKSGHNLLSKRADGDVMSGGTYLYLAKKRAGVRVFESRPITFFSGRLKRKERKSHTLNLIMCAIVRVS